MGYLLSPSPPLHLQHHPSSGGAACRRRARRGAAFAVASSSSSSPPNGGPSPSADASVLARRAVLLGASAAIPLVRLREAAAAPTAADTVTATKDVSTPADSSSAAKPDNPQSEGTQAETLPYEARQPESSLQSVQEQSPGNPVLGLLNFVIVAASGVLAGLYGASRQENKALESIISSMENKLAENEAGYSLMRENYEKRLSEQQAAQKKQSVKFQEQETSLLN